MCLHSQGLVGFLEVSIFSLDFFGTDGYWVTGISRGKESWAVNPSHFIGGLFTRDAWQLAVTIIVAHRYSQFTSAKYAFQVGPLISLLISNDLVLALNLANNLEEKNFWWFFQQLLRSRIGPAAWLVAHCNCKGPCPAVFQSRALQAPSVWKEKPQGFWGSEMWRTWQQVSLERSLFSKDYHIINSISTRIFC